MPRYVDISPYEDGRIVLHADDPGVPVKSLPTADVVEIVRCRNCKYSEWDAPNESLACYEPHYKLIDFDFFCKYGDKDETPQEQKNGSAEWISLGYRPGPFKHPFSEDFKCSVCGHEVYTVMWTPPEYCPACKSFMKNGGMRFVEGLETDGGKPDER